MSKFDLCVVCGAELSMSCDKDVRCIEEYDHVVRSARYMGYLFVEFVDGSVTRDGEGWILTTEEWDVIF